MTALRTWRPDATTVRALSGDDYLAVRELVDAEPYVNAVLAARLDAAGSLDRDRIGGDVLGVGAPGRLVAGCYSGGNLLPLGGEPGTWQALAHHLGRRRRVCTSIIGRADVIQGLWPELSRRWGTARAVRGCQPLLVIDRPALVMADPQVRPARPDELDRYLPAAAAMFGEELGIAPFTGPSRPAYRAHLAELIAAGRAFVRTDERGQVIFKAELAAVSRHTAQVQGVWVRPDHRGHGVATAAMAAVIAQALRFAPTVSLYVNDFNVPARRLYDRLGMRRIATLATVLF